MQHNAEPATVVVSRDGWGDARTARVPVAALRNPHMATHRGGDVAPFPAPTLCAYMHCTLLPDHMPFGHACGHDSGPHSIKVVIERSGTESATWSALRARADAPASRRRRRWQTAA